MLGVIPSRFSNVYVLLSQTGAGVQELRENEDRGSQPPRQYAPTPHCPYSKDVCQSISSFNSKLREVHSREQQGADSGHLLPRLQV